MSDILIDTADYHGARINGMFRGDDRSDLIWSNMSEGLLSSKRYESRVSYNGNFIDPNPAKYELEYQRCTRTDMHWVLWQRNTPGNTGDFVPDSGYYEKGTLERFDPPSVEFDDPSQACISAFYEALADSVTDVGTNLATLDQTIGLLCDSVKFLTNAARHPDKLISYLVRNAKAKAKKGAAGRKERRKLNRLHAKSKKPPSVAQRAAEAHIIVQYGFKPLIDDIHSALDEFYSPHFRGAPLDRIDIKKQRPITVSETHPNHQLSKVKNVARIVALVRPPNQEENRLRWTTLNPLTIAWELTPFSFMIDWFIGVGNYMQEWETYFKFSARVVQVSFSRLVAYEWTYSVDFDYNSPPNIEDYREYRRYQGTQTGEGRHVSWTRTTALPTPRLKVVNLFSQSPAHLLNAAALMQLVFRGK